MSLLEGQKERYVSINHSGDEVIASILAPRQEREISTGEQQGGGVYLN